MPRPVRFSRAGLGAAMRLDDAGGGIWRRGGARVAFQVVVMLRGGTKIEEVVSPEMSQEEAEQQVAEIRDTLGTRNSPKLAWLAVKGPDLVGARVVET